MKYDSALILLGEEGPVGLAEALGVSVKTAAMWTIEGVPGHWDLAILAIAARRTLARGDTDRCLGLIESAGRTRG